MLRFLRLHTKLLVKLAIMVFLTIALVAAFPYLAVMLQFTFCSPLMSEPSYHVETYDEIQDDLADLSEMRFFQIPNEILNSEHTLYVIRQTRIGATPFGYMVEWLDQEPESRETRVALGLPESTNEVAFSCADESEQQPSPLTPITSTENIDPKTTLTFSLVANPVEREDYAYYCAQLSVNGYCYRLAVHWEGNDPTFNEQTTKDFLTRYAQSIVKNSPDDH